VAIPSLPHILLIGAVILSNWNDTIVAVGIVENMIKHLINFPDLCKI
jgi:hypothetical protein